MTAASVELVARAKALAANKPGKVSVPSTTNVAFAAAAREATELLDESERRLVDVAVDEVTTILHGVEGHDVALREVRSYGERQLGPTIAALIKDWQGTIDQIKNDRANRRHNEAIMAAGGPKDRPAPVGLLKAAEYWLVASLLDADKLDEEQRAALRLPWESASVTPTAS